MTQSTSNPWQFDLARAKASEQNFWGLIPGRDKVGKEPTKYSNEMVAMGKIQKQESGLKYIHIDKCPFKWIL